LSSFDSNINLFVFFSRQTNIINEKIRRTIEAIRFAANYLLKKSSREEIKSNDSKVTIEEANIFLYGLQMLFDQSDYDEQIRLLTIAPRSWGRKRIETFFSCNKYQAEKSIKLRDSFDILTIPNDLRGSSPIDPQVAQQIIDFYQNDAISRQSANKKDVIHIRKQPVPIRHMSMTVGQAYQLFVKHLNEKNPDTKVGVSTFYSLKPKWVKINRPHDVCSYLYHENFNLLVKVNFFEDSLL
jgi:hypothetical protein